MSECATASNAVIIGSDRKQLMQERSVRTILATVVIGLAALTFGQSEAVPFDCVARISQVSIKPVAQQELDIEGRKSLYGVFVLSNRSNRTITVLADIHAQKYLMVHPNSASLQRKDGDSWIDDFVTLSEYSGPDKKVFIPSNDEWRFIHPLADLVMRGASRTQEYRLVLQDVDRCSLPSAPFTLESLGKMTGT